MVHGHSRLAPRSVLGRPTPTVPETFLSTSPPRRFGATTPWAAPEGGLSFPACSPTSTALPPSPCEMHPRGRSRRLGRTATASAPPAATGRQTREGAPGRGGHRYRGPPPLAGACPRHGPPKSPLQRGACAGAASTGQRAWRVGRGRPARRWRASSEERSRLHRRRRDGSHGSSCRCGGGGRHRGIGTKVWRWLRGVHRQQGGCERGGWRPRICCQNGRPREPHVD